MPIPGTRHLERVEENLGAADVRLTSDELEQIESRYSDVQVQGARLPQAVLDQSYR